MITEDYVSFETAKLLKEKGFDVYVRSFYEKDEYKTKEELCENEALWNWNISSFRYSAPTLQMAMKWLREAHNLFVFPFPQMNTNKFWVEIYQLHNNQEWANLYCESIDLQDYSSYEEACEAAIKYCLENLI